MRRVIAVLSFLLVSQSMAHATDDIWVEPQTEMPFVKVAKDCYRMGSDVTPFKLGSQALNEVGYKADAAADEKPEHQVCLSTFWIGRYEVRADEWLRVMASPPPEGHGQAPASGIAWRAAAEFAERLTSLSGGKTLFRLPTEAEWEIACLSALPDVAKKPGSRAKHEPVASSVNFVTGHRAPTPRPAGSMQPNGWGIHDMLGNVWEWVQDAYDPAGYTRHALYDPVLSRPTGQRVIRGGSHRSDGIELRCANRAAYPDTESMPTIGFRLVRVERP